MSWRRSFARFPASPACSWWRSPATGRIHRRRALDAGFHHYLVKPVNIDDIEGLLVQRSSRSPD